MKKTSGKPLNAQVTRRRIRTSSGLTFIELLIAIVILLAGLLACLAFITIAIASSVNAQKLVTAKELAEDTMEQVFAMRDLNSIGGLPQAANRNDSTFFKLGNTVQGGIFPDTFQVIQKNNGPDLIRGTSDDTGGMDPQYNQFQIRILVRSATSPSDQTDPFNDPLPTSNDNSKRLIIEVRFPFLRTRKTQIARLETYITQPPSQVRVSD